MCSGPADVVAVRLDPELRVALAALAGAEDTRASEVIRQALRAWLHAESTSAMRVSTDAARVCDGKPLPAH